MFKENDDDEEMGEDGDDGYNPEIKLKGASDVLDQVDKDTEEVLDFNFVPGTGNNPPTGGSGPQGGQGKDGDSVDGLTGEVDSDDLLLQQHQAAVNGNSVGDWGRPMCLKKGRRLLC